METGLHITAGEAVWLRTFLVWGGIGLFLVLETLSPYRPSSVSKLKRWGINLSLTALNGIILNLLFGSAILATLAYVAESRTGLLHALELPPWARLITAVIIMDFILYVWHLLNHEMPTLWRLHKVHHSDLNMDVSTATRFHIGELSISAAIKIFLIYSLGINLIELLSFEALLILSAQFHHSVIRIPEWFERVWWILFVPPSMHRIHHSVIIRESNSNYGTIFSVWDRLFGTLLKDVDQQKISIGIREYQRPEELGIARLLAIPFARSAR